jgi:hypothetical protein
MRSQETYKVVSGDQTNELWRWILEEEGFRLSRSKTKYMKCGFSATTQEEGDVGSRMMGILLKMLVIELKPPC